MNQPAGIAAEQRALKWGMASNITLGIAGVVASLLSNSQALLVDGLFSMVGFGAAFFAIRISARALQGPDKTRPLGYAVDEAIFSTFRAFLLFGLVVFAGVAATLKIINYAAGTVPAELDFRAIGIYMVLVLALSGGMWHVFRRAWIKGGRKSDVLKLEASAVGFDALMTAAAGVGFGAVYLLRDGPFAVFAPIGDSLIVLGLCGLAAVTYFSDFKRGVAELAGVTADPKIVLTVGRMLREIVTEQDGRLVDYSVLKTGRLLSVIVYLAPVEPITGAKVDVLTGRLNAALATKLGHVEAIVVVSENGRRMPDASTQVNDAGPSGS